MSILHPLRAAAHDTASGTTLATGMRLAHRSRAVRALCLFWLCAAPVAIAIPCAAQEVSWHIRSLDEATTKKFKSEFLAKKEQVASYLASKHFSLFPGNIDVSVYNGNPFSEALLF